MFWRKDLSRHSSRQRVLCLLNVTQNIKVNAQCNFVTNSERLFSMPRTEELASFSYT